MCFENRRGIRDLHLNWRASVREMQERKTTQNDKDRNNIPTLFLLPFFFLLLIDHVLYFIQCACLLVPCWCSTFTQMFWRPARLGTFGFPFRAIFASILFDLFMLVSWFGSILWHLESRRCCEFYQWCTLKSSRYKFLLLLLTRPCSIFYACSSVMLIFNFRINVSEVVQLAWGCLVSHFLRFLQAGYRPSCLHSLFMLVMILASYDISNLADVMDRYKFYPAEWCTLSSPFRCSCIWLFAVISTLVSMARIMSGLTQVLYI